MALKQAQLARALGIDKSLVSRYKARGMPVDSIEAALAWKAGNVRARVDTGRPPGSAPAGVDLAAAAGHLAQLAHTALKVGQFERFEGELREALRLVPALDRRRVEMSVEVWNALTAYFWSAVAGNGGAAAPEATGPTNEGTPLDRVAFEELLYLAAAGLVRVR